MCLCAMGIVMHWQAACIQGCWRNVAPVCPTRMYDESVAQVSRSNIRLLLSPPSHPPPCIPPAELSADPPSSSSFSYCKVFDQPGTVLYYMSGGVSTSQDGDVAASQSGVVNVTAAPPSHQGTFQSLKHDAPLH